MTRLQSIEEIRSLVADVRNKRKGFITNFYLDEFKHNVWAQKGDFFYEIIGETLFLIRKSDNFWNVFYNSIDIDSLESDLAEFSMVHSSEKMMFDIVGRKKQCIPLLERFRNCGYQESVSLVRMIRFTEEISEDESFSRVTRATTIQAKEVYNLLHSYFVAENEQIPYLEELELYADMGHILVYTEDSKVIGFMVYEQNATTLYWRYWFVHPDYREKHIGSILFHRLFYEANDTKRQLLWVIRTNENAKKRQEHYGFKEEDMYDFVMKNN